MPAIHILIAEPVFVPLLGAALLAALRKHLPRPLIDLAGFLIAAANLLCCGLLLHRAWSAPIVEWFGNWTPRGPMALGIAFYIDPVSAALAMLAAVLTLLAFIFSSRDLDEADNHFQPLMLIFLAAMSGFVMTGDLFNMFVFFELMSVAAFALCGLDTKAKAPLQGAFNFAVSNTIAAFFVLTGIALLYAVTGALNLAQVGSALAGRHDTLVLFACTLLFCGYMTKAAIVPFHFWLADAHAVAPTPVCVLFSGLMVELGLYAVFRLRVTLFQASFAAHAVGFRNMFLAIAAFTVLIGGLMCYAEHHLKRMLAFSTICHAGLMLIGIAIGTPVAVAGMFVYLVAHAFIKSSLFFVAGTLLHRFRTVSEQRLFARARNMPVIAALWFLGGLGLAAAPLLLTARGESLTEHAATTLHLPWVSLVFVFGGLMTSGAVFRTGAHTFFGWGARPLTDASADVDELPETSEEQSQIHAHHVAPPLLCLVLAIGMTAVPSLSRAALQAAAHACDQQGYLHHAFAVSLPEPVELVPQVPMQPLPGTLATIAGALLALTSVFRLRVSRYLRLGVALEKGPRPLRRLHSGHVGDYVAWMTLGVSVIGACLMARLL